MKIPQLLSLVSIGLLLVLASPASALPECDTPSLLCRYQIVAAHSGQCADMLAYSPAAGGALIQFPCKPMNDAENQQFVLDRSVDGYYSFRAIHSGLCLEVAGGSRSAYVPITQAPCNAIAQQQFAVTEMSNGLHRIQARHSGKCVDVLGVSRDAFALFHQWDCLGAGATNQLFRFVRN